MRKFVVVILLFSLIGCQQKDINVNPQTAILGKWKIVGHGNDSNIKPTLQPTTYEEYKADGVFLVHEYSTAKVSSERYYFKGDTLYRGGGSCGYKCQLYSNRMRLDVVNCTAILYTSIYERIN